MSADGERLAASSTRPWSGYQPSACIGDSWGRSLAARRGRARGEVGRLGRVLMGGLVLLALGAFLGCTAPAEATFAVPIPDLGATAIEAEQIGAQVWVGTDEGVYRVAADLTLHRVPGLDLRAHEIKQIGDHIWVGTNDGAYRVAPDLTCHQVPGLDAWVEAIEQIGDHVWVGTRDGAYRVAADLTCLRVPGLDAWVRQVKQIDDHVWLNTSDGVYRVAADLALRRVPGLDRWAYEIKQIGDHVWVGMEEGAYRVPVDGIPGRVPGVSAWVCQIEQIDGAVWLGTDLGAYRVAADLSSERVPGADSLVDDIERIGDHVWLATNSGAYRVAADGTWQRVPEVETWVEEIQQIGNDAWLRTHSGAYRVAADGTWQRIPDLHATVYEIEQSGDHVWLRTSLGVYRVSEDNPIRVGFQSHGSRWKAVLDWLPGNFWTGGVRPYADYVVDQRVAGQTNTTGWPRDFEFIVETEREARDEAVREARYSEPGYEKSLGLGARTLFYAVREKTWGNTLVGEVTGLVVPASYVVPLLLTVAWAAMLGIAIAFAPYSRPLHSLLMNPWARKVGSLGLVPLALSVSRRLRGHMMRRYARNVREEDEFAQWQERFVRPSADFDPVAFQRRLDRHRALLLLGQSGVGKTCYFKYLVGRYVSRRRADRPKRGVLPVFLPLARYQGQDPERIFRAQLARYGQLTDPDLADWYLSQGGFIVLMDGANEVDEKMRRNLSAFIDQHRGSNYLCINSQLPYPEFEGIADEVLAPLEPDGIRKLLASRVGGERAEAVLSQLTDEAFELLSIPQNLEFAAELVEQGRPVPSSRPELYDAVLRPIFEEWRSAGRSGYPDLLEGRAYEMVCTKEAFFDRAERPLPDAIRDRLTKDKILVSSGERRQFRHELIRSWLAAEHFAPRWRSLLADEKLPVDASWRSMLELAVLKLGGADEVGAMVDALLQRDRALAGDLFRWMRDSHPDLIAGWAERFKHSYGEAALQ